MAESTAGGSDRQGARKGSYGAPSDKSVKAQIRGEVDYHDYVASCGHMNRKRRVRSTYAEAKTQELAIKEAATAYGVEYGVVTVREAKDQFSSLLDRAERGEHIVITSDGRPKAMIVRYRPMILGAKWTSRRSLRQRTSVSEDSTTIILGMRDSGY